MAKQFDIAKLPTGGFDFENGDFKIKESTEQHFQDLLIAEKGSYRATPEVGVGVRSFLLDDNVSSDELKREVMLQFENDGAVIDDLNLGSLTSIQIIGNYGI